MIKIEDMHSETMKVQENQLQFHQTKMERKFEQYFKEIKSALKLKTGKRDVDTKIETEGINIGIKKSQIDAKVLINLRQNLNEMKQKYNESQEENKK